MANVLHTTRFIKYLAVLFSSALECPRNTDGDSFTFCTKSGENGRNGHSRRRRSSSKLRAAEASYIRCRESRIRLDWTIHGDVFFHERYLLNEVGIKIKLVRSRDAFCLCTLRFPCFCSLLYILGLFLINYYFDVVHNLYEGTTRQLSNAL